MEKKIENKPKEGEAKKTDEQTPEFPGKEFGTHAMSPQGVEYITVNDLLYQRTSTTAKVWNTMSLIDYFKDHVVVNALPDTPEEQLPIDLYNKSIFISIR